MSGDKRKMRFPASWDPSQIWSLLQAMEEATAEFSGLLRAMDLALDDLLHLHADLIASQPPEIDSPTDLF